MKNLLIAPLALCALWACAPTGHHDPSGTNEGTENEAIFAEDFEAEGGDELEVPPDGAVPLSEIIFSLEVGSHTAITEVEFENGVWDIDYVVGGEEYEILVDPMTGEALPDESDGPGGD